MSDDDIEAAGEQWPDVLGRLRQQIERLVKAYYNDIEEDQLVHFLFVVNDIASTIQDYDIKEKLQQRREIQKEADQIVKLVKELHGRLESFRPFPPINLSTTRVNRNNWRYRIYYIQEFSGFISADLNLFIKQIDGWSDEYSKSKEKKTPLSRGGEDNGIGADMEIMRHGIFELALACQILDPNFKPTIRRDGETTFFQDLVRILWKKDAGLSIIKKAIEKYDDYFGRETQNNSVSTTGMKKSINPYISEIL